MDFDTEVEKVKAKPKEEKVESFQIKRYIQLALYDNDRLAFICAVHMYKELDEFITNKMAVNEEVENNYTMLQQYNGKSIRPYYDIKYIELENYPKQLAYLQNMLVSELQKIHQEYEKPLTWIMAKAIDEASSLYEAVFGLINDWGGRVP